MVRFGGKRGKFLGKRREISRERFWLFIRHTTLSSHYFYTKAYFNFFYYSLPQNSASLSLSKHTKTKTERQRARRNERRAETTLNVVVGIFSINRVCRSTREMRNSHRPSLGSCREGRGVFHRNRWRASSLKESARSIKKGSSSAESRTTRRLSVHGLAKD